MNTFRVVFYDIGDTLAKPVLKDGKLVGLTVLDGVVEALQAIGGTAARVQGVISNTGEPGDEVAAAAVDTALDQTDLGRFFPAALRLYSSREGMDKTDTAIFLRAAKAADAKTSECLFVGENANERKVARAAGFQTAEDVPAACILLGPS